MCQKHVCVCVCLRSDSFPTASFWQNSCVKHRETVKVSQEQMSHEIQRPHKTAWQVQFDFPGLTLFTQKVGTGHIEEIVFLLKSQQSLVYTLNHRN